MAIVYEGRGTKVEYNNASSMAVPYPATVNAGDLLIAQFVHKDSAYETTSATGWSTVRASGGGTTVAYGLWYKIADGTETGSVTFTGTDQDSGVAVMHRFSGVSSTGIGAVGSANQTSLNATINSGGTPSSVTTTADNSVVALFGYWDDDTANETATGQSTGYATTVYEDTAGGSDSQLLMTYKTVASASTNEAPTITMSGAGNSWAVVIEILAATTITGTLTQTLANATISSAATVLVKATSAQTLADVALSATGTVLIQSALSQALQDVGISATATVGIAAVVTQTLEDAAIVATGEVKDRDIIEGTLSVTLDDVQITAYGTLLIQASVGVTLDDVQIVSRIFKWHWVDPDNDDTWTLAADDDDSWSDQADTNDSWTVQLDDDDTWTNDSSEATTWH